LAEYWHTARNYTIAFDFTEIDDGFRADLGYVPRVDYRRYHALGVRRWIGSADQWFSQIECAAAYFRYDLRDGSPLLHNAHVALSYDGPMQSYFYVQPELLTESYRGELFKYSDVYARSGMRPTGYLYLGLEGRFGGAIDYSNARPARTLFINPEVELRPSRNLSVAVSHYVDRLSDGQGPIYSASSTYLRATYQFSIRARLRGLLQYLDYDFSPGRYAADIEPQSRGLYSQLLFGYTLNARTVIYLGYSDSWSGASSYGLTQRSRTFFAKLGYAWQL
jgi:hypothetical protein